MPKVIVVNGPAQVGKDTFVNFCLEELEPYGSAMSTVDFIKELAVDCGWNGEKDPMSRKYLSDLKQIFTDWLDTPMNKVKKEINNLRLKSIQYNLPDERFCLFVHCREPKEIARMAFELGAITVLVDSAAAKLVTSNQSDLGIYNYDYDYVIHNDGSLDDLKNQAKYFINKLEEGENE